MTGRNLGADRKRPYRVGSNNPRNIYRVDPDSDDYFDDIHVGCMFNPDDGHLVVAALNATRVDVHGHDPDLSHRTGAEHRQLAERYLGAARDHLADSTRQDRPDAERAEAAKNCRLLSGLAFAHALLASPRSEP